ncbi:MAG: hypothetical protein HYR88_15215 [Verrucomicrobia bacterium]|nr:hypothetical protein [Verrucomicrobiota bacterium]
MSLMDALLLEEYHDPAQVWITQRSDGRAGSATINDPADGGRVTGPAVAGTSVTYDPLIVLVVTQNPHGYSNGDSITLSASNTGKDPLRGPYWATFSITKVSSRAFTFQLAASPEAPPNSMNIATCQRGTDAKKGAVLFWPVAKAVVTNHGMGDYDAILVQGSPTSQFNGSFVVLGADDNKTSQFYYELAALPASSGAVSGGTFSKYTFRFDNVMNGAPSPAFVRLGSAPPGNAFESRGVCSAYVIDPGTNPPTPANWAYYAGFRVKNAQRFQGSGMDATTVKLVFAVDRYNQTSVFGRPSTPPGVSSVDISDMTLDGAIASQPAPPNTKNVTAFAPVAPGGVSLYGENLRLRRVRVINFGTQSFPECFPLYLSGGVEDGTNRLMVANNVIEDCVANKPGENNFHEITVIWAGGAAGTPFQQFIQGNGVASVARRNYANFRFLNGASTYYLWIQSIDAAPNPATGLFNVRVQPDPSFGFFRAVGHNVVLGAIYYTNLGSARRHPYYNGSFAITVVSSVDGSSPTQYDITCQMLDNPSAAQWTAVNALSISQAYLGVDFHGPIAYAGTGAVVEQNAVYDCTNPGYTDTGSSRDITFRGNYFSDVFTGFNQNFNPGETDFREIQNTAAGAPWVSWPVAGEDNYTVQVVTVDSHYMSAGDVVEVRGVLSGGTPSNSFNGVYMVTKNVNATTFLYRLRSVPNAGPDTPPYADAPFYGTFAQTRRAVIEGNLVDLYKTSQYTYPNPQGCIGVVSQTILPVFPGWVVRENSFRHTDGLPTNLSGLGNFANALRMYGLTASIVEANLIDLEDPTPLQFLDQQPGHRTFNNTKMSGQRVYWTDFTTTPHHNLDELITAIEDALSLSF